MTYLLKSVFQFNFCFCLIYKHLILLSHHQLSNLNHIHSNSETTSSVDSFGKSTGLLHDDKSEEKFTTVEHEHVLTSKRSTTQFPIDSQQLTQTETIIPGKTIETRIFANDQSRTYVVDERAPVKQSPSRPIIEKKMPGN